MEKSEFHISNIIERVDIFHNLSVKEVQSILHACAITTFHPTDKVYNAGDLSTEMLTLLKGQLLVVSPHGDVLGEILVGDTVGEMGLLTNNVRSANVIAAVESTGLAIDGAALNLVLQANPNLHLKVIQNALSVLCDRLVKTNVHVEQLSAKVRGDEGK